MKKIEIITTILFFSTLIYANSFEKIGSGIRAKGMGDAFSSLSGDLECVFYNPAGIFGVRKKNFYFSYRDMYNLVFKTTSVLCGFETRESIMYLFNSSIIIG